MPGTTESMLSYLLTSGKIALVWAKLMFWLCQKRSGVCLTTLPISAA